MTVKKRPHEDIQSTSDGRDVHRNSPTYSRAVVIEPEDDITRRNRRPRNNDPLLNLLFQAIVAERVHPEDRGNAGANIFLGNNSVNNASTVVSRRTSLTVSNSTTNEAIFAVSKQIVNRVPPDETLPAIISKDECIFSLTSTSPLPSGRPLMAPPRLPAKFIPGKLRSTANASMPIKETLPCIGRNNNKKGLAMEIASKSVSLSQGTQGKR